MRAIFYLSWHNSILLQLKSHLLHEKNSCGNYDCLFTVALFAQENAHWLRYPSISPDGKTIIFGYMGNLYRVSSEGGMAMPITTGDAYDMRPVWSNDGKTIAFASDRYGNFDVFTMPATGGTPVRLTYYSTDDYPYDFTADDNRYCLAAEGTHLPKVCAFPAPAFFKSLYHSGKRWTAGACNGCRCRRGTYSNDGSKIVFEDRKGYEDDLRKAPYFGSDKRYLDRMM